MVLGASWNDPVFLGVDSHFVCVRDKIISEVKSTLTDSITEWEEHIASLNVSVNSSTGPISTVTANIDYITDIEPTQERISQRIDANE